MFRRRSTVPDNASARPGGGAATGTDTDEPGGKGRATPSRKQAEAERKERLKASSRGDTKSGRRSSARSSRSEATSERAAARKRMMAGDENALPPRDRGPERRYVRDLVDSHRSVGQYFLFLAIAVLVIGLIQVPAARIGSQLLLGVILVALVADSLRVRRLALRGVRAKFPAADTSGIGGYAMKRAMVTRRLRVPSPQADLAPIFSGRTRDRG